MRFNSARLGLTGLLIVTANIGLQQSVVARASVPGSAPCVTLGLTASPTLNTAMIPEIIASAFTSCSSVTETITAKLGLSAPFKRNTDSSRIYKVTLTPGQTVTKWRTVYYVCCGTYNVFLRAFGQGGHTLGWQSTQFTFA